MKSALRRPTPRPPCRWPGRFGLLVAAAAAALSALAGCGGSTGHAPAPPLPASYIPLTVGPGPRYRPPAGSGRSTSASRAPDARGLACDPRIGRRFGVHVEVFANRHVVLLPPGIGVLAPVRSGAFVRGGRCFYPLVTLDPTGVVRIGPLVTDPTLGTLFALWGQPLGPGRVAGFAGAVRAFVDGQPVPGDPADIRLRRHEEVVLETSGYVVPHTAYRFPDGL